MKKNLFISFIWIIYYVKCTSRYSVRLLSCLVVDSLLFWYYVLFYTLKSYAWFSSWLFFLWFFFLVILVLVLTPTCITWTYIFWYSVFHTNENLSFFFFLYYYYNVLMYLYIICFWLLFCLPTDVLISQFLNSVTELTKLT